MKKARSRTARAAIVAVVLSVTSIAVPAVAQPSSSAQPSGSAGREANKHFQRAVSLYNDGDFRAALIEFRRANEILPSPGVLYNIGQAYFQLQNYAFALTAFERYLAESGPSAMHRSEVEGTLETLRARVGRIDVTTNVAGAEVFVDDESVGKAPLTQPVLVSVGRRRVSVIAEGRPPASRNVDVAAGDTTPVNLAIGDASGAAANVPAKGSAAPEVVSAKAEPKGPSAGLITAGWGLTGALAVGSIACGAVALKDASDLKTTRESTFPTTRESLDHKRSQTATFSTVADVLGAAALVAGSVTLYLSLSHRTESPKAVGTVRDLRVGLGPNGVRFGGAF